MKKSLLLDRGFSKHLSLIDEIISFTKMKYILFIAMDLALYPFCLCFLLVNALKRKYRSHINMRFLISPIIRTFALSTQ